MKIECRRLPETKEYDGIFRGSAGGRCSDYEDRLSCIQSGICTPELNLMQSPSQLDFFLFLLKNLFLMCKILRHQLCTLSTPVRLKL